MDGKDPENAVIYLKEAYQLAKENNLGEIATAEPPGICHGHSV